MLKLCVVCCFITIIASKRVAYELRYGTLQHHAAVEKVVAGRQRTQTLQTGVQLVLSVEVTERIVAQEFVT